MWPSVRQDAGEAARCQQQYESPTGVLRRAVFARHDILYLASQSVALYFYARILHIPASLIETVYLRLSLFLAMGTRPLVLVAFPSCFPRSRLAASTHSQEEIPKLTLWSCSESIRPPLNAAVRMTILPNSLQIAGTVNTKRMSDDRKVT